MRPQSTAWITRLCGALLMLVSLSDGGDAGCALELRVHRNTVLTPTAGGELRIDCPVAFCLNSAPSVSWCRVSDSTSKCVSLNGTNHEREWIDDGNNSGMSHLVFKPLSINDSGQYRCETNNGTVVSHYINISVSDLEVTTCTDQENLTKTSKPGGLMENNLRTYVYLSAGILGLVLFIIIISFLALRGCRGSRKPRKEQQENQYIAIPLTPQHKPSPSTRPRPQPRPQGPQPRPQGPQPLPELSPRLLPRQASPTPLPDNIYNNAVPKRLPRQQATPLHLSASQGSAGDDFGIRKAGERQEGRRDRAREQEEGENLLVYAALNHQLLPRDAARLPRLRQEEASEYAAIRLA